MAGQKRSAKSPPSKRGYTLRQRRASMDETRARIMDAALELYETVGPAGTSISAVAARARVTRATLYRHFPADADLANAVIDEWSTGSGRVDEAALTAITDPTIRLRTALVRLYGGYRATEAMTANLLRDAHALPAERQDDLRLSARLVRESVGSANSGGRAIEGGSPSGAAAAAIGHAVTFETWRSLRGEGLDDAAIVDLMLTLVDGATDGSRGRSRNASGGRAENRRGKSAAPGPRTAGTAVTRKAKVGAVQPATDAEAPGPKAAGMVVTRKGNAGAARRADDAEAPQPKAERRTQGRKRKGDAGLRADAARADADAPLRAADADASAAAPGPAATQGNAPGSAPRDAAPKKSKGGKGKGGKKGKGGRKTKERGSGGA